MDGLQFSREDLVGLARRLTDDNRSEPLSRTDKALLLAIFEAAAEQVSALSPLDSAEPAELSQQQLGEQLIKSFLPESGQKFMIRHRRIG